MRKNRAEFLILAAGVLLRLVLLPWDTFWYDEAFTAVVSRLAPDRMLWALLGDVHPPGWYLISRPFAGGPEWLLRLPAALFSIASLLLFGWWLRRLDIGPGWWAALGLMAFSPFLLRYATEARMYSGLAFAVVCMMVGLSLKRYWLLVVGSILAIWTTHIGALYVLLAFLILAWQERQAAPIRRLAAPVIIGGLVPGLMFLIQFSQMQAGGYWLSERSIGAWLFHAVYSQVFFAGAMPDALAWHSGLLALGVHWFGLVGLVGSDAKITSLWVFAWVPGLIALAISQITPLLLARSLIGSAPALYLLAGRGASRMIKRHGLVALTLFAVLPIFVASIGLQWNGSSRLDVRPLFDEMGQCQTVVHVEPSSIILGMVYSPERDHRLWSGWRASLSNSGMSQVTMSAIGIKRSDLDPTHCWVVADHAMFDPDLKREIEQAIGDRRPAFTLVDDKYLEVSLFK